MRTEFVCSPNRIGVEQMRHRMYIERSEMIIYGQYRYMNVLLEMSCILSGNDERWKGFLHSNVISKNESNT